MGKPTLMHGQTVDLDALMALTNDRSAARAEALSAMQAAQTAKALLAVAEVRANNAETETRKAKRVGWLEAANFLETLGQFSYARALRREAGVVDGE